MKVKELVQELNEANPNAEILIFSECKNNIEILSIYTDTKHPPNHYDTDISRKSRRLYIDIG